MSAAGSSAVASSLVDPEFELGIFIHVHEPVCCLLCLVLWGVQDKAHLHVESYKL